MSNKQAILTLYEEMHPRFVKRMSFRCGGTYNAEDVVHEAFTRALQYQRSFDSSKREIGAWFNTILNNALRDYKREDRMEGMVLDEGMTDTLDNIVFKENMVDTATKEMERLGNYKSEVLHLYFGEGFTVKEIAQVTPNSTASVKNIVQDFRSMMRQQYGASVCS